MTLPKPKNEHRKPLSVSCSVAERNRIDELLKNYPLGQPTPRCTRSSVMLDVIKRAIANKSTAIANNYERKSSKTEFQISCTPQELRTIEEYAQVNLPKYKRSRWIVHHLLTNL